MKEFTFIKKEENLSEKEKQIRKNIGHEICEIICHSKGCPNPKTDFYKKLSELQQFLINT